MNPRFSVLLLIAFLPAHTLLAETPEAKGLRLASQVDSQPKFEKAKAELVLNIYSSSGVLSFSKKMIIGQYTANMGTSREKECSISYVMEPAADRGNSYLAFNYKNRADDKYIYLRGLRKAKKVAGDTKKMSFFGSDFSNDDMGFPDINISDYRYIGNSRVMFKGREFDCTAVEAVPKTEALKNESGYGKKVFYYYPADDRSLLTLKVDYYDVNMRRYKELLLDSFLKEQNQRGETVFYTTGLTMKNVQTGSYTEMRMRNVKHGSKSGLKSDIFTEEYMTRRWW